MSCAPALFNYSGDDVLQAVVLVRADQAARAMGQLVFEGQSHQGPSYSVAVRADYRVTSRWHLGLNVAANNTRDFDSRSAGVVLKFLTRSVPPSTDLRVKSVPDWRGAQPLKF